jgi:hypothetical protein
VLQLLPRLTCAMPCQHQGMAPHAVSGDDKHAVAHNGRQWQAVTEGLQGLCQLQSCPSADVPSASMLHQSLTRYAERHRVCRAVMQLLQLQP